MTLNVTVTSSDFRNMKGIGKASQKPYDLDFQMIYIHTSDKLGHVNPFPERVEIMLEKGPNGPVFYPVGKYMMADSSIYVDRGGNLAVKPVLIPFGKAA